MSRGRGIVLIVKGKILFIVLSMFTVVIILLLSGNMISAIKNNKSQNTLSPPDCCPWDIDYDGKVDPFDSNAVMAHFGCDVGSGNDLCDRCDIDQDGKVDPFDSNQVMAHFGECPDCE